MTYSIATITPTAYHFAGRLGMYGQKIRNLARKSRIEEYQKRFEEDQKRIEEQQKRIRELEEKLKERNR